MNHLSQLIAAYLSYYLSICCLILIPIQGDCASSSLRPGKYIYEGGYGELTIKRELNGKLTFSIGTIFRFMVFMPVCGLDGQLEGNKSIITISEEMEGIKDGLCIVNFSYTSDGINVDSSNCDYFCGTNGSFDGLYLKPAIGCKANEISRSRKKFKQLYDHKDFDKAYAVLSPVLKNCERVLAMEDAGWIRNDIAITEYQMGHYSDCIETLIPLVKEQEFLTESYEPIINATRFNMGLCREGDSHDE
ncbi:MAG: hypothetical protein CDV28_10243 [Candidatus Electronema aureum]|uniref:Tetratricopeptide repeat-containing protein n=1 Tax=Candidatus Electronema aureum TaxID=2005002 RepID=A0A521G4W1_9BACT|nr:MAG: hypothetical protein CDV28_10243 [Candidatus Electronema aureum]